MKAYENKLRSEYTATDKKEFKADFIASYCEETGASKAAAAMAYEQYLNQEGWTADDERVLLERDRASDPATSRLVPSLGWSEPF